MRPALLAAISGASYPPQSADVIVYGATPGGMSAAYEAKRQGRSVIVVGGWREVRVGGMMSGGLGVTDTASGNAFGGLSRAFFKATNDLKGTADTGTQYPFGTNFAAETARTAFENWMTAQGIEVVFTAGVVSVAKAGPVITSFRTADGRTFIGSVFVDSSYEGDLMALAGISYAIGREASDANNTLNGYRTASGGAVSPIVDPYITPGDSNSGLLPYINVDPAMSSGAADAGVQGYCFRQACVGSSQGANYVQMPTTAPDGYDALNYEILLRWIAARTAASTATAIGDLLLAGVVQGVINDVNSAGPVSLDFVGQNWDYPEATYAQREVIWKNHERWQRGWWYLLQHSTDPRIPAGLQTGARVFGYSSASFTTKIHPNDSIYWPTQLYIREARRLVTDLIFTQADTSMTDGTTPRSTKTIAVGNYTLDSHPVQRIAYFASGSWRLSNEGSLAQAPGGTDKLYPIPYDVVIPKRDECTNLMVTFCVAATHVAFSSMRMEPVHLCIGQAVGMAAAIACENAIAVQDVNYTDLRTRLLATPDAVAPILPQTN